MPTLKEAIYDEQVFPLMAQVIAICKEHKIPMLADFAFGLDDEDDPDSQLKCTTALLEDSFEPSPEQLEAMKILKPPPRPISMMTVRDGDGNVTESIAFI